MAKVISIPDFSGVLSKEAAEEIEGVIEDLNKKMRGEMREL